MYVILPEDVLLSKDLFSCILLRISAEETSKQKTLFFLMTNNNA